MLIREKRQIYKHKENGICYVRKSATKAIMTKINGEVKGGFLYEPRYATNGDSLIDFGQDIFILEEDIPSIFELGKIETFEMNVNKLILEYEAEECDFNNKQWLLKSLLRHFNNKSSIGLWDLQLLKLLKEHINELEEDEESLILKEIIKDVF